MTTEKTELKSRSQISNVAIDMEHLDNNDAENVDAEDVTLVSNMEGCKSDPTNVGQCLKSIGEFYVNEVKEEK